MILGRIKNKKVEVQRFFLKDLDKYEGREVEIRVAEKGRSVQQLRYLWGVVYPIVSDHTGFTKEEVHEVYKKKFLTYEKAHAGKVYEFVKSTSDLNIREMAEFMNKIIDHAQQELGCMIPEPDIAYED